MYPNDCGCGPNGPCPPPPIPITPPSLSPALANSIALRVVLTGTPLTVYNSGLPYLAGALVIQGSGIYFSLKSVPANTPPSTNPTYWQYVQAVQIPGPPGPVLGPNINEPVPVAGAFVKVAYVDVPFTLNQVAVMPLNLGSFTLSIYRNGNPVTGLQNISVAAGSPPVNLYTATANNAFVVGDYVQYVYSNLSTSPSAPSGLATSWLITPTS